MLKNYIVISLRNLFKDATYSFINIAGLSIGITCSLLILPGDRFHPGPARRKG